MVKYYNLKINFNDFCMTHLANISPLYIYSKLDMYIHIHIHTYFLEKNVFLDFILEITISIIWETPK